MASTNPVHPALISKIDISCGSFNSEAIFVPLPGNNKLGDSVTENKFLILDKNEIYIVLKMFFSSSAHLGQCQLGLKLFILKIFEIPQL